MKKVLNFKKRVLDIVAGIPTKETLSYKEVANLAGFPGAHRAIGTILSKNFDPSIPCHRVIRTNGTLGGYNRGIKKKKALLKKEGALL